jgi:anthranilate synthase component II
LYQYIGEIGGNPEVFKNDEISVDEVRDGGYSHIVLSPGPGRPDVAGDVGVNLEVIGEMGGVIPLLGVCLGLQMMVHFFGGSVVNADDVRHGKSSIVRHSGGGLFCGVNSPFEAMRYHSLLVDEESLPSCFEVDARVEGTGDIMSVCHTSQPLYGVQFHPESVGTDVGKLLLQNFLKSSF